MHASVQAEARVQCKLCGVMSQKQVLARRHQSAGAWKRGRDKWARNPDDPSNNQQTPNQATKLILEEEPCLPHQEHFVDILAGGAKEIQCPVQGCSGKHTSKQGMRIHSRDWQVEDTIFFEQEGRFPRCAGCGMFAKMVGRVTKRRRCAKMPPRGGRSKW
jgi:hypothetical protein